ncbi:hypothetical protein BU26DRAFT_237923 [Trematosphaeria pertusa]|uniref:Uncharacterized protein n=1 Tax=Trematosphaeria pertusa TaxID=390896 RepID=A0A6A6HSD3_9PLEO|nr:uncharacterized protein BU26DRAFT_237923 [Trematosphaeria pertusa]KAF2240340.1 hypothetical protein BU26DRAFT_237923 [Trematosphaeria pertusa]
MRWLPATRKQDKASRHERGLAHPLWDERGQQVRLVRPLSRNHTVSPPLFRSKVLMDSPYLRSPALLGLEMGRILRRVRLNPLCVAFHMSYCVIPPKV